MRHNKPSIVAIIPARAGSKGIPNKNIRLVGGRPLVYYAIKNALDSELVSRVVVTTDSEQVSVIAKQMGADVRWRDAALCADDVTLDAVIADAVPNDAEWDYVVTMQPPPRPRCAARRWTRPSSALSTRGWTRSSRW